MKNQNINIIALLLFTVITTISGCTDDNTPTNIPKETVDRSSILAERMFDDIGNYTVSAIPNSKSKSGNTVFSPDAGCLQITFDLTSLPYKLILDFGTKDCLCEDGLYRRGKIIQTCAGSFSDSLATLTTTFENFYVNRHQIVGTRSVKNNGRNAAGHLNWDIAVDGSVVLAQGAGTIIYKASHNSEMIEGENTPAFSDNVFAITGTSNGTAVTGQSFQSEITTPLISKISCAYFVSGEVEITPAGDPIRLVNFGGGECDNVASVTANNATITFLLP